MRGCVSSMQILRLRRLPVLPGARSGDLTTNEFLTSWELHMQISSSTKCALLAAGLLLTAGSAFAHSPDEVGTATLGHLRDSFNHPVKNGFGECIHVPIGADHSAECEVKPAPPPVAAAPAPAPAPEAVRQPVRQKVTLQADALFDFDKAVVKPSGRGLVRE